MKQSSAQSNPEYPVEVTTAMFLSGPAPVYRVTLPNGTKVVRETLWGIRRTIRMDKKARKLNGA